jgi:hypothetical protein
MSKLARQQARFAEALHTPATASDLFKQSANGISAYANNVLFNRADALADAYPVVRQLVGDDFFGGMARAFARGHVSTSGDLHRYGAEFADFIAAFPPAADLHYLADAARLDWLCHRAYFAENAPSLSLERLAAIPAEQHGALHLQLAPAVGLLASTWPVASLWCAHRPQGDADWGEFPSPDQGGEFALCWRNRRNRVRVRRLAGAAHAFLLACHDGLPLSEAFERALDIDMEFDIGVSLQDWFADQVIVDFQESPTP